jgi:hypothetical protein
VLSLHDDFDLLQATALNQVQLSESIFVSIPEVHVLWLVGAPDIEAT